MPPTLGAQAADAQTRAGDVVPVFLLGVVVDAFAREFETQAIAGTITPRPIMTLRLLMEKTSRNGFSVKRRARYYLSMGASYDDWKQLTG
jgi:hypothetical protein